MTDTRKGTALPAVTTIADTDSLMVFNSAGKASRISKDNAISQIAEANRKKCPHLAKTDDGWYRIAEATIYDAAIVFVSGGWNESRTNSGIFAIRTSSSLSELQANALLKHNGYSPNKMRIMFKNASAPVYVDIYINPASGTGPEINIVGTSGIKAIDPIKNPSIPEGYQVKEFDLLNGGGVNALSSALYASGGARRHDSDKSFDKHVAERSDDRRNGVERRLRGPGHLQSEWHLLTDIEHEESTDTGHRNCGGYLPGKCSIPKGHSFRGSLHLHEVNDTERVRVAGLAHFQAISRLANGKEVVAA